MEKIGTSVPVSGRRCKVVCIKKNTADSVEILLKDESGEPFVFKPGQFFMVNVEIDGQMVRRTYSATNAPGEFDGALRLGVKRRPGGLVSGYMNDRLKVGDEVVVKGPGGKLVPTEGRGPRHLVLIAGGSGVTPMISMARTLLASEPDTSISLIYCNRCLDDVMFLQELNELVDSNHDRFRVFHVLKENAEGWSACAGRLNVDILRDILNGLPAVDEYLVCGTPEMMTGVCGYLAELGVPASVIRTETFNVPEDI
ncbi:MAG TPA: FAD-binding oxidoreductase [Myxococcota bacterium]|nr:FAD-binding oxidoreductase [Myxococcota bacterium]HOA13839.1 FAD-binding oxidoreductase [Myxococcota bacterium]HOH76942.1 FAD-binding oxidoreductase [Myxococcota bacterium]HPV03071.1 FAD-binding oxidoreductase [Myxococcota bacterium]